jgi:hypothetical protein
VKHFFIFQVVMVTLLGVAWYLGWLQPMFQNDRSFLSYGIAVVLVLGLATVANQSWKWLHYCIAVAPMLGLMGTVIGIMLATQGMAGSESIELRDLGVSTALNTTLMGMMVSSYLFFLETHFKDAPA